MSTVPTLPYLGWKGERSRLQLTSPKLRFSWRTYGMGCRTVMCLSPFVLRTKLGPLHTQLSEYRTLCFIGDAY
ncbi:hypothetical protein VTK56DRAFT_1512 [Thermocarpiscus australiensis]